MPSRITFKEYLVENSLKTLKGSPIKRSNWGVGKDIGGFVYLHRNYIQDIPDDRQALVQEAYGLTDGYDFNVVKVSKRGNVVSFINSPDFNEDPEPTVGNYINVNLDTGQTKRGNSSSIWHHKWLWVKDDYTGFDVQESMGRSKQWLQQKDVDFSRIGRRDFWNKTVASKLK